MRERPILFSGPMIRALLAGTKTQTRRAAKKPVRHPDLGNLYTPGALVLEREPQHVIERASPYGAPGDRLWVREAWAPDPPIDNTWASTQWNGCGRTVSEVPERFRHPRFCIYAANWLHGPIRWTPSIHMPRWASRITLEVTGVRVERLQAISEADALAEGIRWLNGMATFNDGLHESDTAVESYAALWEQINGAGSWDANPWVWCVEFRRVVPASPTSKAGEQP